MIDHTNYTDLFTQMFVYPPDAYDNLVINEILITIHEGMTRQFKGKQYLYLGSLYAISFFGFSYSDEKFIVRLEDKSTGLYKSALFEPEMVR